MAEMFPDCPTGHEYTSMLILLIGKDMFPEYVERGIDERDSELKEGVGSMGLVRHGGGV